METSYRRIAVAAHNTDTLEHDIADSDDYFQYHGGMIATVRALTGHAPRAYIGDSTRPDTVRTRDARRGDRPGVPRPASSTRAGSRRCSRHGYKGAFELAATVDYLFGYDATAGVVEDWMYDSSPRPTCSTSRCGSSSPESNPWALHGIAERLLEAADRKLWDTPDPETSPPSARSTWKRRATWKTGDRRTGARRARRDGAMALFGEGAGEPEPCQHAVVVEAGDGADSVSSEGEDDQPVRVADRGVRVAQVAAEGGLAVRPGGNEPGLPGSVAERDGVQEMPDRVGALVLERQRRHREPGIVGEQGDDRRDVAALERVGERDGDLLLARESQAAEPGRARPVAGGRRSWPGPA